MEQPEEESSGPGLFMPISWVVLAMLGSIAGCLGIGLSAADSESAGVMASQIAAFPLGFVLSAAFAGLVVHFVIKRATTLLRVVAPLGCGCLGGGMALGAVFLFFTTIFPAL